MSDSLAAPQRYSRLDAITTAVALAGAAVWIFMLVHFWGVRPEYADRFLVLLGACWATSRLWPTAPEISLPRPLSGLTVMLLGGMLFLLGWAIPARGSGVLSIWLWLMAAALILFASGIILTRRGWPHLRHFAFPLVFVLFALQPPTSLMVVMQAYLQEATARASANALLVLGYDVKRNMYELSLPGGKLGVVEACSGIRSLTALTALAAFVAFLRGFGPVRGVALVILSVPIVVAANVLRVVLSGIIQENFGARYIVGDWHDALGVAVIIVGLGLILGLTQLLGKPAEAVIAPAAASVPQAHGHRWTGVACAVVALIVASGCILTTVASSLATAGKPQFDEAPLLADDLSKFPDQLGNWKLERNQPIADEIRGELGSDAIMRRSYVNNLGHRVDFWLIVWSSPETVKGYHHPDVCLPSRGINSKDSWVEEVQAQSGRIACTARRYGTDSEAFLVYYWTQEGRRIWSQEDEERAASTLGGVRALRARIHDIFQGRDHTLRQHRLTVIISSEHVDADARGEINQFAARLADAVYQICPWASLNHP